MATVTVNKVLQKNQFGGDAPYGNLSVVEAHFATNSSGVLVDSDQTTAVASADVVRIGFMPAGFRIMNAQAVISDAFRASNTVKLGWAYVDGTDVTATPQDDDYFFAALATDATGRTTMNNAASVPVTLPKDAYIILTQNVADNNAAGILDLVVTGVNLGAP